MAVVTKLVEGKHAFEFMVSEANGWRSREMVQLAANQTLQAGQVIAKDGTGKYGAFIVGDATFGTAFGIVGYAATSDASSVVKTSIVVRDCEVRGVDLVWPSGITAPQTATAIGQLANNKIIVR